MNVNKKRKKLTQVQTERKVTKKSDKNGMKHEGDLSKNSQKSDDVMSNLDTGLIGGFGLAVGVVYIYTMYPTISGGDSGELIAAAHELGVAHPPGYPLFTILAWLSINLVPFGSVAWRVNLLNAVFASLAAFFFTLTIYRYTRSIGCSVFGASMWAFCKLTWTWSSNAEVFGLNNFFITSLLYLMAVFQDSKEEDKLKTAYFGAFHCGLALCNQHTLVVYVIIVGAWVLMELKTRKELSIASLVRIGLSFLLGLSPYIYIPISAYMRPGRWTWGDQTSLQGFIKHFLRQEYGTFDLARNPEGAKPGLIFGLSKYFSHVISEFTVFGLVLCLFGVYHSMQRSKEQRKQGLFVSFSMAFIYLMFFAWRANLDLTNQLFLGVVERFWMQCDAVVVLLAAVGLSFALRFLQDQVPSLNSKICSISLALGVLAFQLGKNLPICNQRNNRIIEEFGDRLMYNMPNNTLLLQVGDLSSNLLRYQYLCEKKRPDLSVLDVELMTYPWAVPMWRNSYPQVTFPGDNFYKTDMKTADGQIIFSFKTFLNANYHRPIISCIGMNTHEYIKQQGFELLPFGPCSLITKSPVDLEHTYYPVLHLALNVSRGWSHKFESLEPTSWERVAAGEMWNARVNIPLFLYYRAEKEQNAEEKVKLLSKAYQLYKEAMNQLSIEDIPDYYHKNFALCCDKLLYLKHDLPKSVILDEATENFKAFIQKNPTDKDVAAIRNAIDQYKKAKGKQ